MEGEASGQQQPGVPDCAACLARVCPLPQRQEGRGLLPAPAQEALLHLHEVGRKGRKVVSEKPLQQDPPDCMSAVARRGVPRQRLPGEAACAAVQAAGPAQGVRRREGDPTSQRTPTACRQACGQQALPACMAAKAPAPMGTGPQGLD